MRHSFAKVARRRRVRGGSTGTRGRTAAANTAVPFQLNWMAGGANAGFAAAVAEGYYKDAGLDVTLDPGQRLRQHRAARRQRARSACLRRRGRGEPADRRRARR